MLRLTDTAIEQVDRRVGDLWWKARDAVEERASRELVHYRAVIEQIRVLLENEELAAVDFRSAVASVIEPLANKPAGSRAAAIRRELAAHPTRLCNLFREAVHLNLSSPRSFRSGWLSASSRRSIETIGQACPPIPPTHFHRFGHH